MFDIIVVGAGVSGMTAAIYGKRAGKKVLLLEASSYGGQIISSNSVENYPGFSSISGFELATSIYEQIISLQIEYKTERVIEITSSKKVITEKNEYQARSVILATGLVPKKLGVLKEEAFLGKGISYCATCDGNFYKKMDVAVVGGGNTALEDALYLSNLCHKVYLIHRRDEFRGEQHTVHLLKKQENVEFIYDCVIKELKGSDTLSSVIIWNQKKQEEKELSVSGLFIAIGYLPNTDCFQNLITLDSNGYVDSLDCSTNVEGIYVAGDVRRKDLRQLITASSDGAIAATKAVSYLNNL